MSESEDDSVSSVDSSLDTLASEAEDDEELLLAEDALGDEDEPSIVVHDDDLVVNDDDAGGQAPTLVPSQKNFTDTNNNRPSWNDDRLFPPPRKTSNPSRAWQFGGFRKENGKLNMVKVVCGVCGKEIKCKNTPSHLSQHLQSEHSDVYSAKDENSKVQPKMSDFFLQKGAVSKYKNDHPKQRELTSKLVEWVVDSNRPFAIVDDKKLREAFEVADPKFKVPSPYKIKAEIRKLHEKKKEEVIEEFTNVDYFSCTNDAGSSFGGKSFVDVNVHYLDKNFFPKKKILDVLEMKENKTADNYKHRVIEKLSEFKIEDKVFSFTTDNENTMRKAFAKEERNGCFAHIQSLSSKKALESQKALKTLRSKLRKVAKKANKSSKFKYALQRQQKERGLKVKTLKLEVKTRFTATHTMIRSFMNDPKEGSGNGFDDEKIKQNIDAVNSAMKKSKFKKSVLAKLEVKDDDIKKMKELAEILDILEEGITLIGGENYATASAVLPFLHSINKVLEEDDTDPMYLSNFKAFLKNDLADRCDDNFNKLVLTKASFFDKRFAMLKFLEAEAGVEKETVMQEIICDLLVIEKKLKDCRCLSYLPPSLSDPNENELEKEK